MTIMSLHTQQIPKLHTVTTPPLLPAAVVIAEYCSKLLGHGASAYGGWRAAGGRDVSSCPRLVIDTDSSLEPGAWRLAAAAHPPPMCDGATATEPSRSERWADPLQIQLQTSADNYNITTCCQSPAHNKDGTTLSHRCREHEHTTHWHPTDIDDGLSSVGWAGLVSVSLMRCLCALGHHQASQFEYLEEN